MKITKFTNIPTSDPTVGETIVTSGAINPEEEIYIGIRANTMRGEIEVTVLNGPVQDEAEGLVATLLEVYVAPALEDALYEKEDGE